MNGQVTVHINVLHNVLLARRRICATFPDPQLPLLVSALFIQLSTDFVNIGAFADDFERDLPESEIGLRLSSGYA